MIKLISGGQTGADRGALEAALELGTPYGGWVPKGRLAEDGQVPEKFDQLREHASPDYPARTWANVRDADATVIFAKLPMRGGSALTLRLCREQERPVKVLDARKVLADNGLAIATVLDWVRSDKIATLNVAGSRESSVPGLQVAVKQVFRAVIGQLQADM